MPNDAMIIAVDCIRFLWPHAKRMRVYAVGIAADNRGKILVTEPPSGAQIRHLPRGGKPSVWDFAGDGYPLYQRTGGLPDIIAAHLLIVRDRSGVRRAGQILQAVSGNKDATSIIEQASKALASLNVGGLAAMSALSALLPVAGIVGDIIAGAQDTILQTISGSLFLTPERRAQEGFSQITRSPDNNMEVEADVFLFDADADKDSEADTKTAEVNLQASGLLLVQPGR